MPDVRFGCAYYIISAASPRGLILLTPDEIREVEINVVNNPQRVG
jgi:hypothetical protein